MNFSKKVIYKEKCGTAKKWKIKKRYHEISYQRKFIKFKYGIQELYIGTLVLALYCYCGDNVKNGLPSKHSFQRKQQYGD